jgi:hypothetical protein
MDSHLCNDIHILGGTVNVAGGKFSYSPGIGWSGAKYDLYIEDATVNINTKETHGNEGNGIIARNLYVKKSSVYINHWFNKKAAVKADNIYLDDHLSVETVNDYVTTLIDKDDRENQLKSNIIANIKVCKHPGTTYTDNGDGTHHLNCSYCMGADEPHTYVNNNGVNVCVCGASKDFIPQALWCEGNKTLYFVNNMNAYQAGGEYDGQTITSVTIGEDVTNTGTTEPMWGPTAKADLSRVVFEELFALATPKSLYRWFAGCENLTTFEGIEHLNTSECTTMSGLFSDCSGLTSIEVNSLDMGKVTSTESMFGNCPNLKTIFCDNTWSGIANSTDMFNGCTSLRGGMGTVGYDAGNANDITYASPETGYFTITGAVFAQALWCDGNKTLYFVHPEAPLKVGDTYNGQTVTSVWSGGNVLATGDTAPGWSAVKGEAVKVVFEDSFTEAKPTSLVSWFSDFTSLTTANLTNLDVSEVQSAASMFSGCTSLTTLYCKNSWAIANTEGMFTGCTNLAGAVNYDPGIDNGTMANPTSGYFMRMWPVLVLNDNLTVSNLTPYTNETVTIYGARVKVVSVTHLLSGEEIPVTIKGNGIWSFIMPADGVIVKDEVTINLYDKSGTASSRTRGGTDSNSEVLRMYKGMTVNVIYDRILSANSQIVNGEIVQSSRAFAVCLPYRKNLEKEFYAGQLRLYKLASVTDDNEFVFDAVVPAIIEGGASYLVVVDNGSVDLSAEGVEIQAIANDEPEDGTVGSGTQGNPDVLRGWWRGTFEAIDNEEGSQLHAFCLNSDGKWRMIRNDTETHRKAYIPPFRAYFLPNDYASEADHSIRLTNTEASEEMRAFWEELPHSYEGDINYDEATGIYSIDNGQWSMVNQNRGMTCKAAASAASPRQRASTSTTDVRSSSSKDSREPQPIGWGSCYAAKLYLGAGR